jgi:hypothetical protein
MLRVDAKLFELGLQEHLPGDPATTRNTPLGDECDLQLLMVFMGRFDEWDMLFILQDRGLIDEFERDDLMARLDSGADPETTLMKRMRRAYYDYYNRTGSRN